MGQSKWMLWAAMGVGLLGLTACDDTVFGVGEVELDPDLEGYCAVLAIVDQQCISCHSTAAPTAGLDLETDFSASIGTPGLSGTLYIAAGDSANSEIYQRSANIGPGPVMPPGSQGVGDEAAAVMAAWIDDGAIVEGCE